MLISVIVLQCLTGGLTSSSEPELMSSGQSVMSLM